MEPYTGFHRFRGISSSALTGASSSLTFPLTQQGARRLRADLISLLEDPESLPDGVDEQRVLSLVVALTLELNGWLEP